MDQNFAVMRELANNSILLSYMTELALGEADGSQITDAPDQAAYLRNLLNATAERTGFKPLSEVGEVSANVEKVGVAGIGLFDANGSPIVSTPHMPPINSRIRTAAARALEGEAVTIDVFMGPSNLPAIGFAQPVAGVRIDNENAQVIGVVVGIRIFGEDLFKKLEHPGETSETAETYLIRATGGTMEYLSPLADGTPPLKRSMDLETPDLAAASALEGAGDFTAKRDYLGDEVLFTSRPLANLPWVLVRKISRAEALAETETRLKTILAVFILIIVGVSVTIIAVWRYGSSLRAAAALEKASIAAEQFENMTKFMRVVTNSQPTVIAAVDANTTYTFANKPAADEANMTTEAMTGKTMASAIGPVKAKILAEINERIFRDFAEHDDVERARESHLLQFGDEDSDDIQVIKSEHIPLRGDRNYPPGVLMVLDDITELTRERRHSERILRLLIDTLVSVVDRRDPFSANHSTRVAEVAKCIGEEMELPEEDRTSADIASRLMNLGKIFVPPELLTKTEELTPEERDQIANSYMVSADLLEIVPFDVPVVETIRQMGETWDGNGPLGLSGEDILLPARVLAVANTFVGMVSPRAYRGALDFGKVSSILLEQAGSRYDRKPVAALINYLDNRDGTGKWNHFRDLPTVAAE